MIEEEGALRASGTCPAAKPIASATADPSFAADVAGTTTTELGVGQVLQLQATGRQDGYRRGASRSRAGA
jgi:hypothetical protein